MLIGLILACKQPVDTGVDDTVVTWSDDQAPTADVVVEAGKTLAIEPGVTATFAAGTHLVVHGTLAIRGTEDAPVTLTGAGWGGVLFEDDAADAVFEDVDDYVSGSIVEHATVSGATRGMTITAASPYLSQVTFANNEIAPTLDTIGGAGLLVREGGMPRLRGVRFVDNVANTFAFGGGLFAHHADPIVQDCEFVGNVAAYGAGITTDITAAPIVGSTFTGNDCASEGGGVSLVSTVSALLGNTFTANHAVTDGGGVHVCVTCDPHAAPFLYDNVITDNVSDIADADEGTAGVGAAFLGAFEGNDVYGNVRAGVPSDFGWYHPTSEAYPDWVANPVLVDNWWGTTDEDLIAAAVFDGADDPSHPTVVLDGIASGPVATPQVRAVLSTRRQRYEEPGEEIPVFLTLYNPGPEVTTTLALTVGDAPFTEDFGFPNASSTGDTWSVTLPENSVWFGKIASTTFDGTTASDVTWTAVLGDAAPVSARYVTHP